MKPSKEVKERRRSEVQNAATLAALYAIARRRNYSPAWAEKLWSARQAKKKPAGVPPAFFLSGSDVVSWSGL
jgi:hypothetical protein